MQEVYFTRYRDRSSFGRMMKSTMTSLRSDKLPTVSLDEFDCFPDFHCLRTAGGIGLTQQDKETIARRLKSAMQEEQAL